MASRSSGPIRSTKRYIASRQVQKLSSAGAAALGQPGHAALEGVAVQVGQAGERDGVALVAGSRRRRRSRRSRSRRRRRSAGRRSAQPPGSSARSNQMHRGRSQAMSIHHPLAMPTTRHAAPTRSGPMRGSRRWRATGSASSRTARSRRRTGGSCSPGAAADAPAAARDDRLRRALDHARADRLPHPSRPRRRPRARVRAAAGGRVAMKRSRGPAAASSRRCARRARRARRNWSRARLPRLDALIAEGVTTVEIKSGYGLTLARRGEDAARGASAGATSATCGSRRPSSARMRCRPNIAGDADGYVDLVCDDDDPGGRCRGWPMRSMRSARGSAFRPRRSSACSTRRARTACRSSSTPSNCPTCTARRWRRDTARCRPIISNISTTPGSRRWRRAGRSRRCCPAPIISCARRKLPPIAALRAAGVPIALATDCNPGTSPLTSLLLVMNMAATLFRLTVDECLRGVTRQCRARAGAAGRDRHAGSRQGVRPGDLGHRAAGRTGLSHRLQPAARARAGTADDEIVLTPGAMYRSPTGARSIAARRATLDDGCRAGDRRERRGGRRASWRGARRSTGSTPASGSWRACGSRDADLATLQRNIVLSHAAGVGEPTPVPVVRLMMALKLASLAQGASGVRAGDGRDARGDAGTRI